MKRCFVCTVILIYCFLMVSCQPSIDLEQEKVKILQLRTNLQNAVIKNDIEAILSFCVEKSYDVFDGKVRTTTYDSIRKDFQKNPPPQDLEIEDIGEPIIKISNDGKMAFSIGESRFSHSKTDSTEKVVIIEFSYLQIYEKVNNEWKYSHMAQSIKKSE